AAQATWGMVVVPDPGASAPHLPLRWSSSPEHYHVVPEPPEHARFTESCRAQRAQMQLKGSVGRGRAICEPALALGAKRGKLGGGCRLFPPLVPGQYPVRVCLPLCACIIRRGPRCEELLS